MTDDCNVPPPSETPESDTSHIASPEDAAPTHPSKAESNRENARHSTGPKTEKGKARSRLNSLKHGILASQTVVATIEGNDERKMFDETVEGLEADYQPVGTLEQLLVQQIASCFWRYRRLLQFENRAAFGARDRRAFAIMNPNLAGALKFNPLYTIDGRLTEADELFREAGMDGIDLPDEYDINRIVRYEGTITRTMHRAMAKLEASRKARKAAAKETGVVDSSHPGREVVTDVAAQERDQLSSAQMMPPFAALRLASSMREMSRKEHAKKAAKEAAKEADRQAAKPTEEAAAPENIETDQTNPNSATYPHTERDRGVILKAIDDLAKLGNPLASKRPPSN